MNSQNPPGTPQPVRKMLNAQKASVAAVNNWNKPNLGIHPGSKNNEQRMGRMSLGIPVTPASTLYVIPKFNAAGSPISKGRIVGPNALLSGEGPVKRNKPNGGRNYNNVSNPSNKLFEGGRRKSRKGRKGRKSLKTRKN